jgi:hypothetical protein
MAYFAKLDENNIVLGVHKVANAVLLDENNNEIEQKGIDLLTQLHSHSNWKQTSFNTRGNIHYQTDEITPSADQSKALRANYAGKGYIYDSINDVFIPIQPFASWTLNTTTWTWDPPIPKPISDNFYIVGWDEDDYQTDNTKAFEYWTALGKTTWEEDMKDHEEYSISKEQFYRLKKRKPYEDQFNLKGWILDPIITE